MAKSPIKLETEIKGIYRSRFRVIKSENSINNSNSFKIKVIIIEKTIKNIIN
jgi:hypothetical protein